MTRPQLIDQPFDRATDVTSIAVRLHPLDVGFDLRAECITTVVDCTGPSLRVSYADRRGERRVMSGPRRAVIQRLRDLGYSVQPVIHYRREDGVSGYESGDILVDETGARVRAVRTGHGVQLEPVHD